MSVYADNKPTKLANKSHCPPFVYSCLWLPPTSHGESSFINHATCRWHSSKNSGYKYVHAFTFLIIHACVFCTFWSYFRPQSCLITLTWMYSVHLNYLQVTFLVFFARDYHCTHFFTFPYTPTYLYLPLLLMNMLTRRPYLLVFCTV